MNGHGLVHHGKNTVCKTTWVLREYPKPRAVILYIRAHWLAFSAVEVTLVSSRFMRIFLRMNTSIRYSPFVLWPPGFHIGTAGTAGPRSIPIAAGIAGVIRVTKTLRAIRSELNRVQAICHAGGGIASARCAFLQYPHRSAVYVPFGIPQCRFCGLPGDFMVHLIACHVFGQHRLPGGPDADAGNGD